MLKFITNRQNKTVLQSTIAEKTKIQFTVLSKIVFVIYKDIELGLLKSDYLSF